MQEDGSSKLNLKWKTKVTGDLVTRHLHNGAGHQGVAEVRAGRDGDQVGPGPLLAVDGRDELVQDVRVDLVLAEAHHVDIDLLLLQLLGQFHNLFLVSLNWRSEQKYI